MERAKTYLGRTSNFIGGVGYMSVSLQWIWSSIPLLYPLTHSQVFKTYFMPKQGPKIAPTETAGPVLSQGIELVLIIAALVFAVGIIIFAIVAVPKSFGKAGKTVTTKGAEAMVPTITQHKKITKKQRLALLSRIGFGIKALLVVAPIGLLFIPLEGSFQLTRPTFIAAGLILAAGSLLLFIMQFVLAKSAKLPDNKIW